MPEVKVDNVDDFVDIFSDEGTLSPFGVSKKYRVRLIVGYKIKGTELYFYQKYGCISYLTEEVVENPEIDISKELKETKAKFLAVAEQTWERIKSQKEWIYEIPLYAYHFGADYEVDSDFVVLGDWEQVGTMSVKCDKVFLMKNGELPDEYKHLHIVKFPEPTGKRILKQL